MKVRIKFSKYGALKFIGHLDVMRYFQKVMRRADIPIKFTEGFSPHMVMSFAQPLGIGLTSTGEYMDIELTEPVSSADAIRRMNETMAEGIRVLSFRQISEDKKQSGMTLVAAASYRVYPLESAKSSDLRIPVPASFPSAIEDFSKQPEIRVIKKTKKSEKEIDIRPMIYGMTCSEDAVELFLAAGSENNLKPDLVMETFLEFLGETYPLHYERTDLYAKTDDGFVTLESLGRTIV